VRRSTYSIGGKCIVAELKRDAITLPIHDARRVAAAVRGRAEEVAASRRPATRHHDGAWYDPKQHPRNLVRQLRQEHAGTGAGQDAPEVTGWSVRG
jgi:hypothetical protein